LRGSQAKHAGYHGRCSIRGTFSGAAGGAGAAAGSAGGQPAQAVLLITYQPRRNGCPESWQRGHGRRAPVHASRLCMRGRRGSRSCRARAGAPARARPQPREPAVETAVAPRLAPPASARRRRARPRRPRQGSQPPNRRPAAPARRAHLSAPQLRTPSLTAWPSPAQTRSERQRRQPPASDRLLRRCMRGTQRAPHCLDVWVLRSRVGAVQLRKAWMLIPPQIAAWRAQAAPVCPPPAVWPTRTGMRLRRTCRVLVLWVRRRQHSSGSSGRPRDTRGRQSATRRRRRPCRACARF
jgi:hypothetical protein